MGGPTQDGVNQSNWAQFLSGNTHTAYALLAIIGMAFAALLLGWGHPVFLAVVLVLGAGILVDEWSHGFTH